MGSDPAAPTKIKLIPILLSVLIGRSFFLFGEDFVEAFLIWLFIL